MAGKQNGNIGKGFTQLIHSRKQSPNVSMEAGYETSWLSFAGDFPNSDAVGQHIS
jgi:hypothetical protein